MYERHFGLSKRLFPADSAGSDVFVGPQTVETMAGIKKALRSRDAVVAMSGPTGSGKSTLVSKALDALGDSFRVVRIGRIRLKGADVLEFLLEQLGVEDVPSGTIRQFSVLRAALAQLEADNVQLVVVIEDASHCGAETIAELEALTASDAGESGGAAIVLMGDERLGEFLADAQLARLTQRVRDRREIKPLSEAEMRGYLLHRFRQAGGDFDASFDKRAALLVHALSGGIPRVANSILEAVMTTAAAAGENPVSATAVAAVAKAEFGLEARLPARAEPAAPAPVDGPAEPQENTRTELEKPQVPEPEAAEPVPVSSFDASPETIIEIAQDIAGNRAQGAANETAAQDVPAPEPVPEPEPEPEPELESEPESEPEPGPESVPVAEARSEDVAVAEFTPEEVPEWEREPTLAEMRPDLEALEKAMALAHRDVTESPTVNMPAA
ncbi:MAG: AAA family ATPase, partial [Gammaproteobacteria bacterium]|nr:AAA family ATPase [Gammaproteobacteria bacterium]